jgi:cytochrome c553
MSFAITGLPPSTQEIDDFVNDPASDDEAISQLANRLLDSPHFGERWGRHWLDLVRYAESRGHEYDYITPNPWHYRDYVIRSLNDDLPFDQFFVEHVAGDLLNTPRTKGPLAGNESILATGFWYLGDWIHSPTDIRADEMDRIDNQLDVFGRAFLGLTIACARCHDHKFDAISSDDYYALAGYLQSSSYRQVRFETMEHNRRIAAQLDRLRQQTSEQIKQLLNDLTAPELINKSSESTARMLLQAAAAIRDKPHPPESGDSGAEQITELAPWIDALRVARDDPQHPLHAFALAATGPDAPQSAIASWQAALNRYRAAAEDREAQRDGWKLLFDYESLPAGGWRQDGCAFGPGPVRCGDFFISGKLENLQIRIATETSARQDLRWPKLRLAAGTQRDPGFLEDLRRSGRMLKTGTFEIEGQLHYLVKGKGMLQIVVASHRMIKGPLHEHLVRKFDTKGKWQWVTAELQRYQGQRAHIEFVPDAGTECRIRQVASGKRPPLPQNPAEAVALMLDEPFQASTLEQLARMHADAVQQAVLAAAGSARTSEIYSTAPASIADWALSQPQLLPDFYPAAEKLLKKHAASETELLRNIARESATALSIWDSDSEDETLLIRGDSRNPGAVVPRRNLVALGGQRPADSENGSGRLELAHELIRVDQNPLLPRVIVNRVWHHLFGRGIVRSVDNFGELGDRPSHPELLDHLASTFVEQGWSLKSLIHRIVTSRTYRQRSLPVSDHATEVDPDNLLLSHMRVRRLEGEAIRDAILAISGRLKRTIGGTSVPIHLTPFTSGRGRPKSGPLDGAGRRSIYLAIRRNFLPPWMLVFDMPIPLGPVGRRNQSNVPAQPLALMNDPFVAEQSRLWAQRVLAPDNLEPTDRIDRMNLTALGRKATPPEIAEGLAFLKAQGTAYDPAEGKWQKNPQAWADYAHVLLNLKEFIFIQ